MIDREDVLQVAESLGIYLTEYQIDQIIEDYPAHADEDQTATWNLIVEDMIYNIF